MLDRHLIAQTSPEALAGNQVFWRDYRVSVLTERLFRVEQGEKGAYCDKATQGVWYRNLPQVSFCLREEEDRLSVITDRVTLVLEQSPEKNHCLLNGKKVSLENEGNLSGTVRTLDSCNGRLWVPYEGGLEQARELSMGKGILSRKGVAVLDDSASLVLLEDGTLAPRAAEERDQYVFAYGHDYRGALRAFYRICGSTPLIPRFALGNWWSRYHAYTEKEYLHTMDSLAERDVPFTVATVDMDWHWSTTLDRVKRITEEGKNDEKHGGSNGWTGYSWNTDLFPDYRRFLRGLHERGLHVTLNLHPAEGVRYFEDQYEEMAREMGLDPATEERIPFDPANPDFVNAYFKVLHKPYEHDGVDFWWIDWQQGNHSSLKGLDPLWALNHYHYLDNGLEKEPLILSRYCGAGSHRYPLGFSGDTFVTWETLDFLPYFTATASNIGYTWWSHDIGGHMGGVKDDELYVRFLQFGVFSPILRLHSTSLPTFTKEPWAYKNGSGLIAEEFLRLRHRLIPLLYSASVETTERGLALVEPMYYEYPEKSQAYEYPNQYLFAGQLLAAPVTRKSVEQGLACTKVWLPEGTWTDFFTGEEYRGEQEITMVRFLDTLPVLAREGAILVLDDRKHTNRWDCPEALEVRVYRGNGTYVLHEEEDGKRLDTVFTARAEEGGQRLVFSREAYPSKRQFRICFPNLLFGEVQVRVDGRTFDASVDDNGCVSVWLDLIKPWNTVEILVCFDEEENQVQKRVRDLRTRLTCLSMGNWEKNGFYERLCDADKKAAVKMINAAPISQVAREYLLELYKKE